MRGCTVIAFALLLSGCVGFSRKPVEIYRPPVAVKPCAGAASVALRVKSVGVLDTNRMLYRQGGRYFYYERSIWFCEPACLVEEALKGALKVDNGASCELEVEILDFGPWADKNAFGVELKVSETLKCPGGLRRKIFSYNSTLDEASLVRASAELGRLLSKLVVDTCSWLK